MTSAPWHGPNDGGITMVELTAEQKQALDAHPGRPVRVVDRHSQQSFVLLTEAMYEKLKAGAYDDSPWTDEEMALLAQEDADRLGWDGMEVYQDDQP